MRETEKLLLEALKKLDEQNSKAIAELSDRVESLRQELHTLRMSFSDVGALYISLRNLLLTEKIRS